MIWVVFFLFCKNLWCKNCWMHLILCHKAKVTIQGLLSSVCGMKQACRGGWLSTHNRALWWEKVWWWPKSRQFHSQVWSWFSGVCWASCTKVKAFWGETSTVTNYKPCLYQSTVQPLSFVVLLLAFFKHEYGKFLMLESSSRTASSFAEACFWPSNNRSVLLFEWCLFWWSTHESFQQKMYISGEINEEMNLFSVSKTLLFAQLHPLLLWLWIDSIPI